MKNNTKTNLVERDDERGALGPQEVEALDRLRLQAVHQIHHQDGDVAQRAPSRPQVSEGLVTRRVDHKHTRQLHVHFHCLVQLSHLHRSGSGCCPGWSGWSGVGLVGVSKTT